MAEKQVVFQIIVNGNAAVQLKNISAAAEQTKSKFKKLGDFTLRLNNIYAAAVVVISKITSAVKEVNAAYNSQIEAEAKLSQVMRNTMGATARHVDGIKALTAAQQRLGVVGDEVQLAGAQELATYLTKTETLEGLIPIMNDMLAQQYGLNATQEQAAQIASMLGKVMDGQVGALSRYGYKFDKAQEKILKFGTEEQRAAVLAEVVGSAVGGVNRRLALTNAGRAKQLANNFGDLKEQLGQLGQIAAQKALPVASKLLGIVQDWIAVSPVTEIAREKAELNVLVGSLIQASDKEGERKRIIDELHAKYPDFLKDIDLEKASTADLRAELEKVNAEYDKRMRKAAYMRRKEALEKQYADKMDDMTYYEMSVDARKKMKELRDGKGQELVENAAKYLGRSSADVAWNVHTKQLVQKNQNGAWVRVDNLPEGLQNRLDAANAEYASYEAFTSGRLAGYDEEKLKELEKDTENFRRQIQVIGQSIEDEFGSDDDATNTPSGNGTVTPNTAAITGGKETARRGVETATTGGTRNTTVNITIGQMKGVETLNVDSLEQGVADLEQRLAEAMSRVLGMAEMSV